MDKAYTPTDYVYPACLPESAFDKYENTRVNVSGWGSLNGKETVCALFLWNLCRNVCSLRSLSPLVRVKIHKSNVIISFSTDFTKQIANCWN